MKMTDDELKALVASLAIKSDRLDAQMSRTDEKMAELLATQAETGVTLKEACKLLGNIGRNQGDVAEEFFFNSLVEDNHLGAIRFDDVTARMQKHRGQIQEEYDLVLTNGDAIGIVEVKYKAHQNDLNKLERKMRNFKKLFPVYENYKLYGALAAFHLHEEAKKEALERGFFVLQRSGKLVHTDCAENLLVM
jgi:hypothetical protein